jgi:hypothetical protein
MTLDYSLTFSIGGMPKTGKTTFAIKFPYAFIIDFASVNMGMAHAEIINAGKYGESHFSVREYFKKFSKDPDVEMQKRYRFVKTWDEFMKAIDDARKYKSDLEKEAEKSGKKMNVPWLVLDDSYRWRVFTVLRWLELQKDKTRKSGKDIKWPAEAEWGLVSQLMTDLLTELKNEFHIVLTHRMKDEYIKNVATGEIVLQAYPGGIHYTGDVTMEVAKEETDGKKKKRVYNVIWNRFEDDCSDEAVIKIDEDISPIEMLYKLHVPEEYI